MAETINVLYQPFPTSVTVNNQIYPVKTDYRDWLNFFDQLQEEAAAPVELIQGALLLYAQKIPDDIVAAYYALLDFASLSCIPQAGAPAKKSNGVAKQTISYRYDAGCIIADFIRFYRIDLTQTEGLHWYKFRILLENLPDESETKQRAGYRAINLAEIKDKKTRERVRKIQNAIRIPQKHKMTAGQVGAVFG